MLELRNRMIIVLALGIAFTVASGAWLPTEPPPETPLSISDRLLAWGAALAEGNGRVTTGFEDSVPYANVATERTRP